MTYESPGPDDPLDQGDSVDGCSVINVKDFRLDQLPALDLDFEFRRVYVMTQTCDLANRKTTTATVAEVYTAQSFVDRGLLKPSDIRGPLRAGRIWGLYYLPADAARGLPEMVVDFRRLHTVKVEHLLTLCRAGERPGRVPPLYREHLAKHFADTFSRIGLPIPYATL